jgi:hypothetical protein
MNTDEAIYVVVTPSKAACDSFHLVRDHQTNEIEYDLSDYVDECENVKKHYTEESQSDQVVQSKS